MNEQNEKATKKFCSVGKSVNTVDDIGQIQKPGGGEFRDEKERGEHVKEFYSNLYKKRIDRVIEIENFFTEGEWANLRENGRKLDEETKGSLEGMITMDELKKSLDGSNMSSCPGWDGVSYKCLSTLWEYLKYPMLKMAHESFQNGILSSTMRTGVIKLIPKGKNNTRVEDWRPISLLSTSYKVINKKDEIMSYN